MKKVFLAVIFLCIHFHYFYQVNALEAGGMICENINKWSDTWLEEKQKIIEENRIQAFDESEEKLNIFIESHDIKERISKNFFWWNIHSLRTSDNYEVVYYEWRVSNKYKEIIDLRNEYNMDFTVWQSKWSPTHLKDYMIYRVSNDKKDSFIYAKKENDNYIIAKNFNESPEFVEYKEFMFDGENKNILFSAIDGEWNTNIYLNNKIIYTRVSKKRFDNELAFSENGKYLIWDRDSDGNVILNFNGEIISTNYTQINKIHLSQDGTSYWFAAQKNTTEGKHYPYIFKDGKQLHDLTSFFENNDEHHKTHYDELYTSSDTHKAYILLQAYDLDDNGEQFLEQYIIVEDKILKIPYDDIVYTSQNNFFYYKNDIFALTVSRKSDILDEYLTGVLYYNANTNQFRLSDFYKRGVAQIEFVNFWNTISFIWGIEDENKKLQWVFINNFIQYDWFLEKYWIEQIDYDNKTLKYLRLKEWWVTWIINEDNNQWCFFPLQSKNIEEIILNKLDKIYLKSRYEYNSNYYKLERKYKKILVSLKKIDRQKLSYQKSQIFDIVMKDIEATLNHISTIKLSLQ